MCLKSHTHEIINVPTCYIKMCLLTMIKLFIYITYNTWKFTFIKLNLKMHLNPSSNTCQLIVFIQMYAAQKEVEWWSNNIYVICIIHVDKIRFLVMKFCIFPYKINQKIHVIKKMNFSFQWKLYSNQTSLTFPKFFKAFKLLWLFKSRVARPRSYKDIPE